MAASSSSSSKMLVDELKDAGNRLLKPPSSTYELLSLLDEVEHLLSKVGQAPSGPMQEALFPLMKALIAPELLRHSEINVKVSVTSCINEITRVTAPDAPYTDEEMKEIFEVSVMALEKLSLSSGRCYTKAVSILHNIAAVRSCLVMLDLEFDELIVEMFQVFLKTIRSDHSQSVFSDMEAIMTLVIDESEEIPLELLIPLLSSVSKENQKVSPLSWKLGENVLKKCAPKLKPYLPPAVQFMRINPSDYAEIVFSVCQDASGMEDLEVAKELAPKGDGSSVDGSSKLCQSSRVARSDTEPDRLDSTKAVSLERGPESVTKKRGRKPNSSTKPGEGYEHSRLSGGRKDQQLMRHMKNHAKETKPQVVSPKTSYRENIVASADKSQHKRGRPNKNIPSAKEDVSSSDTEGKQESKVPEMDGRKQSRKQLTRESGGKKTHSFSATGSSNHDESQLKEASTTKSKRKRIPQKEEVSEVAVASENYGEELVGYIIKVWWPLDRMFYEGAIHSFDPIEKKHKVLYADGDEEMLDLSTERWMLVTKNNFSEQGQGSQGTDPPSSDSSSDMKMDSVDASSLPSSSNEVDPNNPLWNYVTRFEKLNDGGGNVTWRCNFCNVVKKSSYTRVRGHLLNLPCSGIRPCEKVTSKDLETMQRLEDEAKTRTK